MTGKAVCIPIVGEGEGEKQKCSFSWVKREGDDTVRRSVLGDKPVQGNRSMIARVGGKEKGFVKH